VLITGCAVVPALCQRPLALSMGKCSFRPPTESTPLTDHQKLCHMWLCRRPLRLRQIRCISVHGRFWAYGWNITKIIFIYSPFWGTHLQVRHADGFSRVMAQTTRTCARMCLFWNSSHCSPFRRSKNPKTPNFKAWIGVFKQNSWNRKTCLLSKLLHRFQTNFAQW